MWARDPELALDYRVGDKDRTGDRKYERWKKEVKGRARALRNVLQSREERTIFLQEVQKEDKTRKTVCSGCTDN